MLTQHADVYRIQRLKICWTIGKPPELIRKYVRFFKKTVQDSSGGVGCGLCLLSDCNLHNWTISQWGLCSWRNNNGHEKRFILSRAVSGLYVLSHFQVDWSRPWPGLARHWMPSYFSTLTAFDGCKSPWAGLLIPLTRPSISRHFLIRAQSINTLVQL